MKKLLWIVLALMLAIMPAGSLFAQDAPPVLCGDLAEEDCTILQDAAVADKDVTEASYAFDFDIIVAGIPDMPVDEIAFNWAQEATYVTDPALSDDMKAYLEGMDADGMDAALLGEVLGMIVGGVDVEQSFVVTLSDDLAGTLSSEAGMPIPTMFGLNFAIIDGIIYVNVSDLAEFVPELAGMPFQGWVGTELAPILDLVLAEMGNDPDAMAAMGPIGATLAGGMASASMAEGDLDAFNQFVEVTRLDDDTVGGEDAAVFETVFDFVAFASSPEFIEYVKAQMAMAEMMGADAPSEAEIAEMEEMMPMVAPMVFGGMTYSVLQAVGLNSGYTNGTAADMYWDLASLMEMGGMSGDTPAQFSMSMVVETSDQNAVGAITPPEGAFVVPAQMLLSMMGG